MNGKKIWFGNKLYFVKAKAIFVYGDFCNCSFHRKQSKCILNVIHSEVNIHFNEELNHHQIEIIFNEISVL